MRLNIDEIDEFFKLPPESFAVDPIHWWAGRRAQFPNLSHLARDILSIPGMFNYLPPNTILIFPKAQP